MKVSNRKFGLVSVLFVAVIIGAFFLGRETTKSNNRKILPEPNEQTELKFTTFYYGEIGENHMYVEKGSGGNSRIILIDKRNAVFSATANWLTKKENYYTFGFSAESANKYPDQSHVYYFDKINNGFSVSIKSKQ